MIPPNLENVLTIARQSTFFWSVFFIFFKQAHFQLHPTDVTEGSVVYLIQCQFEHNLGKTPQQPTSHFSTFSLMPMWVVLW